MGGLCFHEENAEVGGLRFRECGRWAASGSALKKAEVGGLRFLAEESGGGRPLFLRRGLVEVGGLCFTSGADVSRLTDSRSPNGWVLRHTFVSRMWVIGCLHSSFVSCSFWLLLGTAARAFELLLELRRVVFSSGFALSTCHRLKGVSMH